jgi:hypothetical protein
LFSPLSSFLNAPVTLSTPNKATIAQIKNSVKLGAYFVAKRRTIKPTNNTIQPSTPQTLLLDNLPLGVSIICQSLIFVII